MVVEHRWTPEQHAAIHHRHGPLRVIAGAGSGKTATMTEHIAQLIRSEVARPEQIVALTFTNAAAGELTTRLQAALKDSRIDVWSGTYHSFGGQIVSDGAARLGLPVKPHLLSEVEVWLSIRKLLRDGVEIEQLDMTNFAGSINDLVEFISRCKDELASMEMLDRYIANIPEEDEVHAAEMRDRQRVFAAYTDYCRELGAIDFGDQIQLAIQALDTDPALLQSYRSRYRFFVVDEYQDTNFAQAELVKRLAIPEYDLRVVGDPNQSIYRFRGAAVDNIQRLSDEVEGLIDVSLSTSFRSPQPVLDIANRIVDSQGTPAELRAHDQTFTERPVLANGETWHDEVSWISDTLAAHREEGVKSMAVLTRKRKLLPAIARALEKRGIPAQILGGEGIFDLPAVKDAVATIRILHNPSDRASAVRVLTSPRCGLNDRTVYALRDYLQSSNYLRSLKRIVSDPPEEIDAGVIIAARRFLDELRGLVRTARTQPVDVMVRQIITSMQWDHPDVELQALQQLTGVAVQFTQNSIDTSLDAFVDYLEALDQLGGSEARIDIQPEDDAVALMTVHGAKGLEFDVVVLAGLNRQDAGMTGSQMGILPTDLRHDRDIYPRREDFADRSQYLDGVKAVEQELAEDEQRRLYYVAVTRSRRHLYLTWSKQHPSRKKPTTRFSLLDELAGLVQEVDIPVYPAPYDDPPLGTFFNKVATRLDPTNGFARFKRDWEIYWRGKPAEREALNALDLGIARYRQEYWNLQQDIERLRNAILDSRFSPAPRNVFSYSQIAAWEQCPRRYLLQYVVGVPPNPAHAYRTRLGTAFHDALHAQHIAREQGEEVDFQSLLQEALSASGGDYETEPTDRAVSGFLSSPDSSATPLRTEQEFFLRLRPGPNAPVIHGFIDRIQRRPDGEIEIVDYKTHRQSWSRDNVLYDLQLPIYVLACREALGLEPRYATMAFVRHGNWVRIDVNDFDMSTVRQRLDSAIAGINSGHFPCTCGGSRCEVS